MPIEILVADYTNPKHGQDIGDLLDAYAREPLGGAEPLPQHVKDNLAKEKGCCTSTLDVFEGNPIAQNAYKKFGFIPYELDPALGKAFF